MSMELEHSNLKVFLNHIYELKKGVRRMALYTTNKKYEDFAVKRLSNQNIKFIVQEVDGKRINLFFGCDECIEAIRLIVDRPLNKLTPEEDFILGAMLGYDICVQCRRYCHRKNGNTASCDIATTSLLSAKTDCQGRNTESCDIKAKIASQIS